MPLQRDCSSSYMMSSVDLLHDLCKHCLELKPVSGVMVDAVNPETPELTVLLRDHVEREKNQQIHLAMSRSLPATHTCSLEKSGLFTQYDALIFITICVDVFLISGYSANGNGPSRQRYQRLSDRFHFDRSITPNPNPKLEDRSLPLYQRSRLSNIPYSQGVEPYDGRRG